MKAMHTELYWDASFSGTKNSEALEVTLTLPGDTTIDLGDISFDESELLGGGAGDGNNVEYLDEEVQATSSD